MTNSTDATANCLPDGMRGKLPRNAPQVFAFRAIMHSSSNAYIDAAEYPLNGVVTGEVRTDGTIVCHSFQREGTRTVNVPEPGDFWPGLRTEEWAYPPVGMPDAVFTITDLDRPVWNVGDPIDYSDPTCSCSASGMGRKATCGLHGLSRAGI